MQHVLIIHAVDVILQFIDFDTKPNYAIRKPCAYVRAWNV